MTGPGSGVRAVSAKTAPEEPASRQGASSEGRHTGRQGIYIGVVFGRRQKSPKNFNFTVELSLQYLS